MCQNLFWFIKIFGSKYFVGSTKFGVKKMLGQNFFVWVKFIFGVIRVNMEGGIPPPENSRVNGLNFPESSRYYL